MTIPYSIRAARPEDAPRIAVLGAHVWVHTYAAAGVSEVIAQYVLATFTPERCLALAGDAHAALLVAESNHNLAGYLAMRFGSCHTNATTEIETLYVQASFAGQGVGSALLAHARDIAMSRTGSRSVWLKVNSQNDKAISFYRSRGMKHDGIAHFELGGTQHENMVMLAAD